jgi:hypothetical protein
MDRPETAGHERWTCPYVRWNLGSPFTSLVLVDPRSTAVPGHGNADPNIRVEDYLAEFEEAVKVLGTNVIFFFPSGFGLAHAGSCRDPSDGHYGLLATMSTLGVNPMGLAVGQVQAAVTYFAKDLTRPLDRVAGHGPRSSAIVLSWAGARPAQEQLPRIVASRPISTFAEMADYPAPLYDSSFPELAYSRLGTVGDMAVLFTLARRVGLEIRQVDERGAAEVERARTWLRNAQQDSTVFYLPPGDVTKRENFWVRR